MTDGTEKRTKNMQLHNDVKSRKKDGKVWLVGAGPSDPGLMTLKGREVLSQAQVVVYDALVGVSIRAMFPAGAEYIYVGKRSGCHAMAQEEINRLLLEKAQEGKRVVRLKGGDPFVFGRGGEELELLVQAGIAFEVVPGVTSALSVPAYGGIPVTHRDMAGSFHVITGHRKENEPLCLPFAELAGLDGTLIFLMGMSALPDIMRGLLAAGMDPATPAAVLSQGTTGRQRKIIAAIAAMEETAAREQMKTPAVIVVGDAAALGNRFAWYERLPLFGQCYVTTRPAERSQELSKRLRELGAEVIELPSIRTEPIAPNPALAEAVSVINVYDCIAFTSPAGVRIFFDAMRRAGKDARSLAGARLAVIGAGTKKALEEQGLLADEMPESYSGEALGALLGSRLPDGARVLIPRSHIGNPRLVEVMYERAEANRRRLQITDLPVYETVYEKNELVDVAGMMEAGEIDGMFFTSASSVRGFFAANPGVSAADVTALCIGDMTAEAARGAGIVQVHISREATVAGLVSLARETAQPGCGSAPE